MRPAHTLKRRFASIATIVAMMATTAIVSVAFAPAAAAAPSPLQDTGADRATADALPTVQVDGVVWSQAIAGNIVWAGGGFANARPAGAAAGTNQTTRSNLVAYNIDTGVMMNFAVNPVVNGQVLAVSASPDGSRVYIAGEFTTVNGLTRNRVAAFNAQTGALLNNFTPNIGSRVKAIVATNDTVYVGGQFTNANGQPRVRLAAYQATNGALTSWAPEADYNVNALTMSPDKSKVIVGGAFQNISGQAAYGLAALDSTTGALLPFAAVNQVRNAGANAAIVSLTSDANAIYGTGYVFGAGGNLEGTFSANPDTGAINWIEDCHGDTYSAFASLNGVYTVNHAHYCGNVGGFPQTDPWSINQRFALAFSKEATGTVGRDPYGYYNWEGNPSPSMLQWYPDFNTGTASGQNQAGWTVTGNDNYILVGGEFTRVNGATQQGLVRFAAKAKATNKSGPVLTGNKMIPNLVSLEPLKVRVAWQANWDRDDRKLNYRVMRNTVTQVYPAAGQTATAESNFWDRPYLGFVDTVPTAGEYRYRVFAYDDDGNQVGGDTIYITVSDTGATPSAFANLIKQQGVGTYWRLSEASGAAAYDWAGFVDGVVGPNVTRGLEGAVIGDADTATNFNGTADSRVSSPNAITGPDTYSTAAWFKTTTTTGGKIIGFGNSQTGTSGSYDRHVYMDNSGKIFSGVYNGAVRTLNSAKSYNDGQWHQVVSSLGPNGMVLYVDGVRVAQRSDVVNGQPYSGYWRVGGDNLGSWTNKPSSNYFNGAIDEVAIFPTVLTGQQVLDQYLASGRPSPIPPAPADSYGAAVYNDQPTLFWRLGEPTGTTQAADAGTLFNTGTYRGTSTKNVAGALSGVSNTAVTFNGSNGMVSSDYQFTNPTVYSEEAWFKTSTTRGGKIIGFGSNQTGTSSSYDRHVYMQNNGQLVFGTYTGVQNMITTPATYRDNLWHHVAATQGPDGMKLYVDGQLVGTNPATGAQDLVGYWRVGGDTTWGSTSAYLAGTIDEAAVYPSVLSAQQVANHYSLGKTGALPNQTPVASFTKTVADMAVTVDGSGSSDPDGSVASYAWNFGDNGTATGATASHTYAGAGTYTVTLTVTDNQGKTGTTTQQVSVTPNQAPVASFTNSAAFLSLSVDGSASADPDGTVASYAWNFGDGGTATGATATHDYAAAGTYTVTLTVTDNKGTIGTTTKQVTVTAPPANVAPTASFTSGSTGLTLSVDGTGSSDPDGSIASYAWEFGDGGTATGATASHVFAAGGTFQVKLTVTDNKGTTGTTTQPATVTAPPPNVPPTAAFDIVSVNGLTVNVDATASADSDGTIQSYAWDFGDGTDTGPAVVHTFATAGTKTIKLTVTDDDGAPTVLTKTVTVTAPPPTNVAPTAAFTVAKTDLTATFNGSTSSDPDGTIASYSWDFGDSNADTGATPPAHAYLAAGTYTVVLTVTDNQGATNAASQQVTVTAPATPTAFATDNFERTVTNGLGSAQVGGAWALNGTTSLFSVAAGTGKLRANAPGTGPLAFLNTVSASDVRGTVDFTYDKAMTGGGTYTSAIVRRIGTSDYRLKVRLQPTSTQIYASRTVNGVETTVGTSVNVPMTFAPGDTLRLAFQVQGTLPTTLSGKVWKIGATEPATWQVTRTDSQAELQAPGAVGLAIYLAGSATNAPVVASFDNLSIGTIPAP